MYLTVPFVSLFGEAPTKQYFSECLSYTDTITFATCPLGIITAIVSTIRVGGPPSLRVFVGRAREGRGVTEVELRSSTSRGVCKLYSNGGSARVLGRPKLLEFVLIPNGSDGKVICLSRNFFEHCRKSGDEWNEMSATETGLENRNDVRFAPNLNLSPNIDINNRSGSWFNLAACTVADVGALAFCTAKRSSIPGTASGTVKLKDKAVLMRVATRYPT